MIIPTLGMEELIFIIVLALISIVFAFARQYLGFGLILMGILLMFKPNVGWIVGVTLGIVCIIIGIALIIRKPKDLEKVSSKTVKAKRK